LSDPSEMAQAVFARGGPTRPGNTKGKGRKGSETKATSGEWKERKGG